jgi:hypothetical protein
VRILDREPVSFISWVLLFPWVSRWGFGLSDLGAAVPRNRLISGTRQSYHESVICNLQIIAAYHHQMARPNLLGQPCLLRNMLRLTQGTASG